MTAKERVLQLIRRLDDDVSMERIMYHLGVMRNIETALAQSDRGEGTEHEAFLRELDKEHEKSQAALVAASKKGRSGNPGVHRPQGV